MPPIHYELTADNTDLIAELSESTAALKKTRRAGDKVTTSTKQLGNESKRTAGILNAFKAAAEGVGGKAGESAGRIEKFSQAFGGLSSAGGMAGVALGGAVAAIGAVGAASVAAALKASQLVKELNAAGRASPISAEALATVENMDREIQMLILDLKAMAVQIGAEVAPAILALVTYIRDATKGVNQFRERARWMWESGEEIRGFLSLQFLWGGIADETARAAREAQGYRQQIAGFALRQFNRTSDAPAPSVRGGSSLARADALASRALAAHQEASARFEELRGLEAQLEAERLAGIQQRMAAEAALARQLASQREAEHQAHLQAMAEARALQQTKVDAQLSAASQIVGSIQSIATAAASADTAQTEAAKKRAKILFRLQQNAALAQIAINTAQAVMQGYAQLGPIAGNFAAIGTIATGAAQAAAVVAQRPPDATGTGGRGAMSAPSGSAPRGLIGQGSTRGGGASEGGGFSTDANGRIVVENRYGHRSFERFISDHLERGGAINQFVSLSVGAIGHTVTGF